MAMNILGQEGREGQEGLKGLEDQGVPCSPSRPSRFSGPSRPGDTRSLATGVAAMILLAGLFGGRQAYLLAQQRQSTFMGGNPSREPSDKISTMRLKFPKGVRSNWHSHSWGQLLMVETGSGLTQERGGPVRVVKPGEPWFTKAGIEHWHGASPTEDMLQLTIYEGDVKWLEPVEDKEYLAPPKK